jgi:rare lipoprotein A
MRGELGLAGASPMDRSLISRLARAGAAAAAALSLAACASLSPQYEVEPAGKPHAAGKHQKKAKKPAARTAQKGLKPGQKVGKPYQVNGRWYVPKADPDYDEVGLASWYGAAHQGKPTANGERFDRFEVSAAHKTLPLPSLVEVTNLETGKTLRVRINDRGPFVDGRIIDLSQEAAKKLGFERKGVAKVRVRYLGDDSIQTADIHVWID